MSHPTFTPRRLEEVAAAYQARLDGGFPVVLDGVLEALQVATSEDRSNWLIFKDALDDRVKAGALLTDPSPLPIRCMSNTNHAVTIGEALQVVADLRAWGFAAQANCWRLKDAVSAAQSDAGLIAVDLTQGWP